MSYILDALKKSEQERGRGSVPSVQTIHSASLDYQSERRQFWPYVLFAAIALNLAALLFFIFSEQEKDSAVATQDNTISESIALVPEKITGQNPQMAEPVIQQETKTITQSPPVKNTEYKPTPAAERPAHTTDVVAMYDLPLSIRQQIPVMVFSAHVYSSNAKQRSIVINNRFMEEGEELVDGLVITEITSDGIIFDYLGYQVSANVITNWDVN